LDATRERLQETLVLEALLKPCVKETFVLLEITRNLGLIKSYKKTWLDKKQQTETAINQELHTESIKPSLQFF
jgi:hypothetical protein